MDRGILVTQLVKERSYMCLCESMWPVWPVDMCPVLSVVLLATISSHPLFGGIHKSSFGDTEHQTIKGFPVGKLCLDGIGHLRGLVMPRCR
eukprot:1152286-Pelagomonas_calceolata.AAC.4